jgi:hypothetical protein
MHLPILAVFAGWIAVGLFLFYRYSVRVAILANFLGGWAVLPGAQYAPTTEAFPYWVLGVCLPTNYLLTKAIVIGFTGLAGVLIFRPADLKEFRPGVRDLPMFLWCCVPLLSSAARGNAFDEGVTGAAYLVISWAVPWILGRIYFSVYGAQLMAAKALVIAGLCYVPICITEMITGPQLYAFFCGYQPYRWVGAGRYFGFRPIGMMEDGNQLGIWMAASALIAVSLTVRKIAPRVIGIAMGWIAAVLTASVLLCQSAGSIVLLFILLPVTLVKRRVVLRWAIAIVVFAIVGFTVVRMSDLLPLRTLAERHGTFLHSVASVLASTGRESFAWRFAREESHIKIALQKPILGFGQWNWWMNGDSRPWSLWLLVFGMYGLVGVIALGSIFFLPVIQATWSSSDSEASNDSDLRLALAAVILMVAIDSLLNGALILPYLLVMGGLATPESPARDQRSSMPLRSM